MIRKSNLSMVARERAAKIVHTMSPCPFRRDFSPFFIEILQCLAFRARLLSSFNPRALFLFNSPHYLTNCCDKHVKLTYEDVYATNTIPDVLPRKTSRESLVFLHYN